MNSKKNRPLYRQLYADMIRDKYPEKAALCAKFLQKKEWIALDVIQINEILFGSKKDRSDVEIDQKHCLHCGRCAEACPKQVIKKVG